MEPRFASAEAEVELGSWAWRALVFLRPARRIPSLDRRRTLHRIFAFGGLSYGLGALASASRDLSPTLIWVYLALAPVLAIGAVVALRTEFMPGVLPLAVILWAGMLGTVDEFSRTTAGIASVTLCTALVSWMGTEVAPQYVITTVTGNVIASAVSDDPYLVDRAVMLAISILFSVVVVGRLSDQARTAHADREALLARLAHESRHDSLTGLANRAALMEAMAIAANDPAVATIGLSFADLDDFKRINDGHGHVVGDRILCAVATRLAAAAGGGTPVRIGGDEFALLTADPTDGPAVEAERIAAALTFSFPAADGDIPVTASVGTARLAGDDPDLERLLRDADLAMYRSKHARKALEG